jgi:diguanylate cyclase (GGDEF)-like protein
VIALYIISALVPLSLCTGFLLRESSSQLTRTQIQSLDGLVRSFGMTLLGRLNGADDVLKSIISVPGRTDNDIGDEVGKLVWVRSLRRVAAAGQPSEAELPPPDPRQVDNLRAGKSAVLWDTDERGNVQIYLVRALPSGRWLYTELNSAWLWADASDYAGDAVLLVLDAHAERLNVTGTPPAGLRPADLLPSPALRRTDAALAVSPASLPRGWFSRSWEMFLAGSYGSPSWQLVALSRHPSLLSDSNEAYLYLFGVIGLTILMIAWLSMTSIRRQLRPLGLLTQATRRIAQRDFDAFRTLTWNDEFGDLARSFDAMSDKLRVQFAALEALAEVDRLLLCTPELELILDTLLPRIARLIGCSSVSVLLFDPDSSEHARAYDYSVTQHEQLPVRRITTDVAALRALCEQPSPPLIDAASAGSLVFESPTDLSRAATIRLQALKHDGDCMGVLCVGYGGEVAAGEDTGISVADFADRISLILTNLKQAERLRRQANYDSLTGLQNRQLFSDHVREAVVAAEAARGLGSLLYIDLDHFKRVNDTAGHMAGDRLLRVVAERLTACVGEGHSIARLGGDEFAVLLASIADPDNARRVAERILTGLQEPITVDGRQHLVSASIGMTVFPADGTKLEDLLKAGDIAMYHAKEEGRARAVFFQSEMQQTLIERMKLESGMQRAFMHNDFALHYQPIVREGSAGALAVEALVRWPGSNQSPYLSPTVFVPVAEENGLIVKLGEWILRTACAQFTRWRNDGLKLEYVSVNVSVRQLREPAYVLTLLSALAESGMRNDELQLEITESVLANGPEVERTLCDIAGHGVRLALDDFGTGYSSLSYLRKYPIRTVKIDRSFIQGLPHDVAACRLAESIIVMCNVLEKNVIAEGVESDEQRQFLRGAGCTTLQGYLLGRPMEAADIPGFVRRLRSTLGAEAPAESAATGTGRSQRA